MTDIKQIPELPVALDAQDSDLLHLRQGPTDKQLTFSALKESIGSSSETGEGLIEVANTTEALAGVDNERSLTPLKLKQVLDTKAYATTSRNTVQNQEALSQGLSQRTGISSTTYTGNGTSQSVVTGVDMDTQWGTDPSERFGGWLWIKSRTTTGPHSIFDTVRGNTKGLSSQNTNTEYTSSVQVTSFNNNGFSVGASVVNTNPSGQDVVAWSWQTTHRASGITNRNKPYEAHYNPALGFSIVGYEGDGQSLHEVPHFLGKEPELVIVKNRDSANEWHVYYGDPDNKLVLNSTAAVTSSTSWGGYKALKYHSKSRDFW